MLLEMSLQIFSAFQLQREYECASGCSVSILKV
jgi:hypothetical protein